MALIRRELQGRTDELVARAIREIYDYLNQNKNQIEGITKTIAEQPPAPAPRSQADLGLKLVINAPIGITSGLGAPEGNVEGKVGDLYIRQDGGAVTTLYVKESGNGTRTGWVAK